MSKSHSNYSLFTRTQGTSFIALLVYVDDILLASNDPQSIKLLKESLHAEFKLKDLGNLKYFLGLEVQDLLKGFLYAKGNMHWTSLLIVGCWDQNQSLLPWNRT